jgi:hypothetical protein
MIKRVSSKLLFYLSTAIVLLIPIDRYFFKHNASFSIRFIYTCIPNQSEWDLSAPTNEQIQELEPILSQDFMYFAKGTHCYAFLSQDQKYIIKFHRYPSHMRRFPYLSHPLSYLFDKNRIEIKEYNLKRYRYFMDNYKNSFEDLKEETGTILVHINRTDHLNKTITLIDKTGNRYRVSLDDVTFILQHKATLVYPTLNAYLQHNDISKGKETISQIFNLIAQSCEKGYVNKDPVLKRNYGLLNDRAIYIDIGDLVKNQEMNQSENISSHLIQATQDLRAWAEQGHPELLAHYDQELDRLRKR